MMLMGILIITWNFIAFLAKYSSFNGTNKHRTAKPARHDGPTYGLSTQIILLLDPDSQTFEQLNEYFEY